MPLDRKQILDAVYAVVLGSILVGYLIAPVALFSDTQVSLDGKTAWSKIYFLNQRWRSTKLEINGLTTF